MTTQNEDTATTATVDPAAAAATTGATTAANTGAGATGDDDGGSLLDGVTGDAAKVEAAKPLAERIPEKYRVTGADGKLDEAASMAKLMDGYDHLAKKLGTGATESAPASPDEYKLELLNAEGKPRDDIDIETFTGDPMFKGFAKGAHEQGLTNKQLNWIVGRYLEVAPQLVAADAELSLEEARTELGKLWGDEASFKTGIGSAVRAMKAYGGQAEDMPGSFARLQSKYGRDPDFLAFAASIGREVGEDRLPFGDVAGVAEGDIEAMQKSPAYWDPNHPDHKRYNDTVREHYVRKHGSKKR
jgi:hypothetical protein